MKLLAGFLCLVTLLPAYGNQTCQDAFRSSAKLTKSEVDNSLRQLARLLQDTEDESLSKVVRQKLATELHTKISELERMGEKNVRERIKSFITNPKTTSKQEDGRVAEEKAFKWHRLEVHFEGEHFFEDFKVVSEQEVWIWDGTDLLRYNPLTKKTERRISVGRSPRTEFLVDSQGQYAYLAHLSGIIKVDLNSGAQTGLALSEKHSDYGILKFSPDEHYLLAGKNNGAFNIVDTQTLEKKFSKQLLQNVNRIEVDPTGRYVFAASANGLHALVDLNTLTEITLPDLSATNYLVTDVAFDPKDLAVHFAPYIRGGQSFKVSPKALVSSKLRRLSQDLFAYGQRLLAIEYDDASFKYSLAIYDENMKRSGIKLPASLEIPILLAISPDRRMAFLADDERTGTLYRLNLDTRRIEEIELPVESLRGLSQFSPDGQSLYLLHSGGDKSFFGRIY